MEYRKIKLDCASVQRCGKLRLCANLVILRDWKSVLILRIIQVADFLARAVNMHEEGPWALPVSCVEECNLLFAATFSGGQLRPCTATYKLPFQTLYWIRKVLGESADKLGRSGFEANMAKQVRHGHLTLAWLRTAQIQETVDGDCFDGMQRRTNKRSTSRIVHNLYPCRLAKHSLSQSVVQERGLTNLIRAGHFFWQCNQTWHNDVVALTESAWANI